MRRRIELFLLLASLAFGAHASDAAYSTLGVHVSLLPATTLPGVPVSFSVSFTNRTTAAVSVPRRAIMRVRADKGDEFTALTSYSGTVLLLEEWPERTLPPNASLIEEISTDGALLTPAWFMDGRLFRPGRYDLQLFFSDVLLSDMTFAQVRRISVSSNVVTLVVREPTGVDSKVWNRMVTFGAGTWHPLLLLSQQGDEFVRSIVHQFPDSQYAGWLSAMGTADSPEERSVFLKEYLRTHPKDPLYSTRLLRAAQWDVYLMDKYSVVDPERSRRYAEAARSALQIIIDDPKGGMIRGRAAERLEYLRDR